MIPFETSFSLLETLRSLPQQPTTAIAAMRGQKPRLRHDSRHGNTNRLTGFVEAKLVHVFSLVCLALSFRRVRMSQM